jgi:hypothetical protein
MRVLFNWDHRQQQPQQVVTTNIVSTTGSPASSSNSNTSSRRIRINDNNTSEDPLDINGIKEMDSTTYRNDLLQQQQQPHHHGPQHEQVDHEENFEATTLCSAMAASPPPTRKSGGLGGGLGGRTKSVFAFSCTTSSFVSSTSSLASSASNHSSQDDSFDKQQHEEEAALQPQQHHHNHHQNPQGDDDDDCDNHRHVLVNGFGLDVQVYTGLGRPVFDAGLRKVMEPYLRQARCERERARCRSQHNAGSGADVHASIANSVGVPYTCLRHERPFLFNDHTFPLHSILAQALGVADLSQLHLHQHHEADIDVLLKPLFDRQRRRPFHLAYHNFVTSFCIPLLHSLAISKKLFHTASATCDYVTYRYQAFPRICISQPGSCGGGTSSGGGDGAPHCAMARGHAVGCLFFHVPLTPSLDTAALHVESHPGRENWHALEAKSVGLGYLYDGARCLQFETTNTTSSTRVSLEFSVLIYRESSITSPPPTFSQLKEDLCTLDTLEDAFSQAGPGYYEEAVIDLTRNFYPSGCMDAVHRKNRSLVDPDYRVGPPFVR